MSCRLAKWSEGAIDGRRIPTASAIVLTVIGALLFSVTN
jgi:hypothetical protein